MDSFASEQTPEGRRQRAGYRADRQMIVGQELVCLTSTRFKAEFLQVAPRGRCAEVEKQVVLFRERDEWRVRCRFSPLVQRLPPAPVINDIRRTAQEIKLVAEFIQQHGQRQPNARPRRV